MKTINVKNILHQPDLKSNIVNIFGIKFLEGKVGSATRVYVFESSDIINEGDDIEFIFDGLVHRLYNIDKYIIPFSSLESSINKDIHLVECEYWNMSVIDS